VIPGDVNFVYPATMPGMPGRQQWSGKQKQNLLQ
jgi:hypothetical protein